MTIMDDIKNIGCSLSMKELEEAIVTLSRVYEEKSEARTKALWEDVHIAIENFCAETGRSILISGCDKDEDDEGICCSSIELSFDLCSDFSVPGRIGI